MSLSCWTVSEIALGHLQIMLLLFQTDLETVVGGGESLVLLREVPVLHGQGLRLELELIDPAEIVRLMQLLEEQGTGS